MLSGEQLGEYLSVKFDASFLSGAMLVVYWTLSVHVAFAGNALAARRQTSARASRTQLQGYNYALY